MAKDITSDLLTWLRGTGYPFQLQAGRGLQAAGWHVNYSRWYKDPETGKQRELDLQALVGAVRPGESSIFLSLSIECKVASTVPWVGLSSRRDGTGRSYVASAPGSMTRRFALAAQLLEIPLPELLPRATPHVDSIVAGFSYQEADPPYSDTKSKKGKPKEPGDPTSPHSALLQAVAAAKSFDADWFATALSSIPEHATASMILPVVLVKGRLFAYEVTNDLTDTITEVDAMLAAVPTDNEDNSTVVAVLTDSFGTKHWSTMYSAAHTFCVAALTHGPRLANALMFGEHEMAERLNASPPLARSN